MNRNVSAVIGAALFLASCLVRWQERRMYYARLHAIDPQWLREASFLDLWAAYARTPGFTLWLLWLGTFLGGLGLIARAIWLDRRARQKGARG